jgi:hypothetical protein
MAIKQEMLADVRRRRQECSQMSRSSRQSARVVRAPHNPRSNIGGLEGSNKKRKSRHRVTEEGNGRQRLYMLE